MPHPDTSADRDGRAIAVPRTRNDPARQSRRLRRTGDLSLLACLGVILLLVLLPVPYMVQTPGPTVDVLGDVDGRPVLAVGDAVDQDPSGELMLLTVGVAGGPGREMRMIPVLTSWLGEHDTVVPTEMYYPMGTSREEVTAANTMQMTSSQDLAVAAALTQLGEDFDRDIVVTDLTPDAPAAGLLEVGDVIRSVDGTAVASPQEVIDIVSAAADGPIDFGVLRSGEEASVVVTPVADADGVRRVGAMLSEAYEFPVDVEFNLQDIGGPSAGLIFSLAIIDHMTPGSLTGGQVIAGTGEISVAGEVGPIGGARQKAFAAHERGADYFLSPADNCDEVVQAVADGGLDDMTVIRVDTLDTAVDALEAIDDGDEDRVPMCAPSAAKGRP